MARLQVKGHNHLVREVSSGGIVNTNVNEYQIYMKRIRAREQHGDQIRNACKEINNLKQELYEIKNLIKELVKN